MTRWLRWLTIAGGTGVVAVGAWGTFHATAHPTHIAAAPSKTASGNLSSASTSASPTSSSSQSPSPSTSPSRLPSTHSGSVNQSAITSYEAASNQTTAPNPGIQIVPDPSNPAVHLAFVPMGQKTSQSASRTLWVGTQFRNGPWLWVPSTLPGALSSQLPRPAYHALAWAYDLHEGQPGPSLPGPISWNSLRSVVSEPVGWTVTKLSASQSLNGLPSIQIVVWMKSYTQFHGYYGLITIWNASNAPSGSHALDMLEASSRSLALTVGG